MALVGYSDSEGSESEEPRAATSHAKSTVARAKSQFQKVVDPSAPRRIKVDLPGLAIEHVPEPEDRPAKKARTGGGFSGFNSFLPAPKRSAADTAKKSGLGSGVSLRTGAAPAFSREPVIREAEAESEEPVSNEDSGTASVTTTLDIEKPAEVKTVGNPMKFRPLSVANKKKPKKKPLFPSIAAADGEAQKVTTANAQAPLPPPPKPKVSLFSVAQDEASAAPTRSPPTHFPSVYQPLMTDPAINPTETAALPTTAPDTQPPAEPTDPNSLTALAHDLNLTPSQRRQLFGRKAQAPPSAINVASFNMDNEYAANEALRAAGQAAEHRAVKAVAPGKHSLQQLVNAASSQKEALEDAWAQGKRNRGEAGSKYGW